MQAPADGTYDVIRHAEAKKEVERNSEKPTLLSKSKTMLEVSVVIIAKNKEILIRGATYCVEFTCIVLKITTKKPHPC